MPEPAVPNADDYRAVAESALAKLVLAPGDILAAEVVAIVPPGWQAVVDASAVRTAQVAPAPMKHG
jgi:hypothetical protein